MQIPFQPGEQQAFEAAEFAENPEPRVACVLLLDTSGSMSGRPIQELNDGLGLFQAALASDDLASKRAETAIVTFGGSVQVVQDFATVDHLQIPTLAATGDTPMSAAILRGAEMVTQRKQTYKAHGISYYRPWIFLLTDGAPTDMAHWPAAVDRVLRGESAKEFAFFPIGVGQGADLQRLRELGPREPLRLRGVEFKEYFRWLSTSLQRVSRSKPGETLSLPPTGWAQVD